MDKYELRSVLDSQLLATWSNGALVMETDFISEPQDLNDLAKFIVSGPPGRRVWEITSKFAREPRMIFMDDGKGEGTVEHVEFVAKEVWEY